MKTSKNIFNRKVFAFLGAAAFMFAAVFIAGCKTEVSSSDPVPETFALTFKPGEHGSVDAKAGGKAVATGAKLEKGTTVEFTATPESGYEVDKWTVTGGELIEGTGAEGSTTAKVKVTGDVTVNVTFTPVYKPVLFSDLSNYLQNTASSTDVNKIEVQGLTAADLKGNSWHDASPLGKILEANSDKKVALKFGGKIEGLTDMSYCFSCCKSLTQAPAIPTGVTDMEGCFIDCTSLTQAPAIPTGVTSMMECFAVCTSLTQAPAIPTGVTNMSYCFSGCTSLTQAPAIPTGVTDMKSCFSGCTSLTQAPAIPTGVTTMNYCFTQCTSLIQASEIPSGVTYMNECFFGCTSLTQAPAIPDSVTYMYRCFRDCTSLTQAPAIPSGVTYMSSCFSGCTKLESAVLKCNYNPAEIVGTLAFKDTFKDCTSLPAGGIKVPTAQLGTYRTNASVMGVPADRFAAE